mgnify:CR=1 FL=1
MLKPKNLIWATFLILVWVATVLPSLAQVDNRVPFKHRVGNPAPQGNIFRIQGDFAIIGNTNLTLTYYNDTLPNSGNLMSFVDVDNDASTLNSSSATLVFSQENSADVSCSEVLYAGLYWSGRALYGRGLTFDVEKEVQAPPQQISAISQVLKDPGPIEYSTYYFTISLNEDQELKAFPKYVLTGSNGLPNIVFQFYGNPSNQVRYQINDGDWMDVQNLQITTTGDVSTATFNPVTFTEGGVSFSITQLTRSTITEYLAYNIDDTSLTITASGTYIPFITKTFSMDKRKVKLKGPGAVSYTEIAATGNSILFPHEDLSDMYAGYSDVTEYVKNHGMGNYTVADLALDDGIGDATGFFGHWGLVVVYQNPQMQWRDVTLYDGYSLVQSRDLNEHIGELEISGFGAVQQGPVDLKLGIMAGEGDRPIEGDFLEIQDQLQNWVRLSHPKNTPQNFFNSSIYTPVSNASGVLVETPRLPNLINNTGIDIVVWDIPNPDNSLIANEQNSIKFRFGTKQDIYNIYALAFSVRSYLPVIEATNQIVSINGVTAGENPTAKPGEEIKLQLQVRNKGEEATKQTKITIPLPHTTTFVSAVPIPEGYGTVTFDPTIGVAGAIIWDIGDVPLLNDTDEVIATLSYTLKVTEDCFVLANNSCEAVVSVMGSVSGVGSNSEIVFSGTPFIRGIVEGTCSNQKLSGPLEIPIVGKAEFAASRCQGYEAFSGLGNIVLPVFCQGAPPVDLKSLISPSQNGFEIYFFLQEEGGTPLFDYQVNTGMVGTEKIWVSEGPVGSCTGFRVPLTLTVIPSAKMPPVATIDICATPGFVEFAVEAFPDHRLIFYPDNNPLSQPLASAPRLDSNIPGRYSVWVSQYQEGICESPRREAIIILEDCSLRPAISVTITADIAIYTTVGQIITYTITVENTSKVPLKDVVVTEQRVGSQEVYPLLGPLEKKSYTVAYTVTQDDLLFRSIYNAVTAVGTSLDGAFVSDDDNVTVVSFPPGFLEVSVSASPETCSGNLGSMQIDFKGLPQNGTYIIRNMADGKEYIDIFENMSLIPVAVPPGSYEITLFDNVGFPLKIPGTFTVGPKENVAFEIPSSISACLLYNLTPESSGEIVYEMRGPSGALIAMQSNAFALSQSGKYTLTGRDPQGIRCPLTKTIDAVIIQPEMLTFEVLPFCKDDVFTTIRLLQNVSPANVIWNKIEGLSVTHLVDFDNNPVLTAREDGTYEALVTNADGCITAKGRVEVNRSIIEVPLFSPLYTICPKENSFITLSAGSAFVKSSWYLSNELVSEALEFRPENPGIYTLVTTDVNGCDHIVEFEVETQCEAMIRYPNAIRPGNPQSAFMLYPDKLTAELEIIIQNRWGELIYYCKDSDLIAGKPSSCTWDGTVHNQPVINGSYVFTLTYKVKGQDRIVSVQGAILVVD